MSVYNQRSDHAARGVAFYDLDGTLMGLNFIHGTLFAFTNIGEWSSRVSYVLALATPLPVLYMAERRDRHRLNVTLFEMFSGHLARPPGYARRGILRSHPDGQHVPAGDRDDRG